MLWLVVVGALVAEDPVLPGALPPLDDALLLGEGDAGGGASVFGQGRIMGGAEDRDIVDDADPIVAAALTGRLGVAGRIGDLRAAVVVGDGAWWTAPVEASSSSSLVLVPRPVVAPLSRVSLEVPVGLFGAPGLLLLGRFPLVIADGRLVGSEPFDARGRSVDGALVDVELGEVQARAGAVLLDLGALSLRDGDVVDEWSGLGFVAASTHVFDVALDLYGLVHHAGPAQLARPTLGTRAVVDVVGLRWSAGLDGQLALDETNGADVVDSGVHAELGVRTLLPWSLRSPRPFLEVGLEGTGPLVAPAPTTHGTLGSLDLVGLSNTWQTRAAIGVDDDTGFSFKATWRLVSGLGKVRSPIGVVVGESSGPLFNELDVDLCLPIDDDVGLDVAWSVALGRGLLPAGPAQRLIVGLKFSFGDDDGLLSSF
ncbi:MAG: hypothetical protein Q8O67_09750 [Deltaproteobacteria bacterium]|nr:hypothetical protein [Deltaproteobacteria bacterium]